jgi:hypothetical protein
MEDKSQNPQEELINELENAEVTELDDANLEDVAGGLADNGNCGNSQCCAPQ